MGPVRGGKGVVDVKVTQFSQLSGKGGIVLFLARTEADIFQQDHPARIEVVQGRFRDIADAVICEAHGRADQQLQIVDHGLKAHLGHPLALRPVKVGQQCDPGPRIPQSLNGRQGRAQPRVVGDLAVLHRDVEVHANEGGLAGEAAEVLGGVVEGAEGHFWKSLQTAASSPVTVKRVTSPGG